MTERLRVCADCGASWIGDADDACGWCADAAVRQRALSRSLLLDPPSLRSSAGDVRYEDLDDVAKRIWDRTRGQAHGTDSVVAWIERLRRGVEAELVTRDEAIGAMRRVTRDRPTPSAARATTHERHHL